MSCLCQEDKRHILPRERPLLISRKQFCEAFFHAKSCHEWDIKATLCLTEDQCYRTVVFLVARLVADDRDLPYVVRYMNCYRGRTDLNRHAEEFLLKDPVIQTAQQGTLELFLTYQPCHLSGGSEHVGTHPISCSSRLVEFQKSHPHVRMTIIPTGIYRAHYTDPTGFETPEMAAAFAQRVQLARAGLSLLVQNGIRLRGPQRADWVFLVSLVFKGGSISEQQWALRYRHDRAIQTFLDLFYKAQVSEVASTDECDQASPDGAASSDAGTSLHGAGRSRFFQESVGNQKRAAHTDSVLDATRNSKKRKHRGADVFPVGEE